MDSISQRELEQKLTITADALRKAEEQALAGRLALELMHEIKNPLEALGHLTYLAQQEAEDAGKVREYLTLAEEQMATVSHIATQTLGFAQPAGPRRPFDLVQVAEAALRIHQRTIESKKVHVLKDLPGAVVAPVHSGQMLQVVSNLIANALDALPTNGTLCLRLHKRNGRAHILVADNGDGIRAEHSERIFQPFFTTKEGRGTGLGLSLSQTIVERHRGKLRMRSSVRAGRSGTTFRISLPA